MTTGGRTLAATWGAVAGPWEEMTLRHRVHRLQVHQDTVQEDLERWVSDLEGELVTVVPFVSPVFQPMAATARTTWLLVVERVATPRETG